jgi:hypothetical protein
VSACTRFTRDLRRRTSSDTGSSDGGRAFPRRCRSTQESRRSYELSSRWPRCTSPSRSPRWTRSRQHPGPTRCHLFRLRCDAVARGPRICAAGSLAGAVACAPVRFPWPFARVDCAARTRDVGTGRSWTHGDGDVSAPDASARTLVLATREDLEIARQVRLVLQARSLTRRYASAIVIRSFPTAR